MSSEKRKRNDTVDLDSLQEQLINTKKQFFGDKYIASDDENMDNNDLINNVNNVNINKNDNQIYNIYDESQYNKNGIQKNITNNSCNANKNINNNVINDIQKRSRGRPKTNIQNINNNDTINENINTQNKHETIENSMQNNYCNNQTAHNLEVQQETKKRGRPPNSFSNKNENHIEENQNNNYQIKESDELLTDHREIIRRIRILLNNIQLLKLSNTFVKSDRNNIVSLMFPDEDYQLEIWDNTNRRRNCYKSLSAKKVIPGIESKAPNAPRDLALFVKWQFKNKYERIYTIAGCTDAYKYIQERGVSGSMVSHLKNMLSNR